MSKIYTSMDQMIGRTPLLELCRIQQQLGLEARVLAKLEYLNPAGSVKDRAALSMIRDAEQKGLLKEGSVDRGAYLRQYRHRPGSRGCGPWLPGSHRNAGDHEPGAPAADAGLRG